VTVMMIMSSTNDQMIRFAMISIGAT
jgi:hypothetical protein